MQGSLSVYDEIAGFMAEMDPKKVISFFPSADAQQRLDELLIKQKESGLTPDEKSEIEHFLIVNRIIGLAKARARQLLSLK